MLSDKEKIGCHIALTPTWNETAFFADYVLPMGHASERHDINSYETQAGIWIAFRQPVMRKKPDVMEEINFTYEVNPVKYGKKMSSGLNYHGKLIRIMIWEFENIF